MPSVAPAPLGGHSLLVLLTEVLLLLSGALLLRRVAERLGLPAVSGELCAGVLIGPSVLGHLSPRLSGWLLPSSPAQFHLLDAIGQLGVLLLVGMTGGEIDLGLIRRRGPTAVRVGIAGLALPLALGLAAGLLAPRSLLPATTGRGLFAFFAAVAMCVSALPVIAKILSDLRLTHRDVGQLTIAAGVVDDVVGWILLSVVSAAATVGLHLRSLAMPLLWLAVIVTFALVVGRPVVRLLTDWAERTADPGLAACTAVLVIVGCAAATQAMSLEAPFGAFVGGLLLGSAAQDRALRDRTLRDRTLPDRPTLLAPLRSVVLSVFAPLYFAEAGLRMNLGLLGRPLLLLSALGALTLATVGKFAGAFLGARLSRLSRWEALALAAGMNARGVIQIIVASVGLQLGVLNTASYTIVVLVAITTSLMAPPVLRFAMPRIPVTDGEEARRQRTERAVSLAGGPPARG